MGLRLLSTELKYFIVIAGRRNKIAVDTNGWENLLLLVFVLSGVLRRFCGCANWDY